MIENILELRAAAPVRSFFIGEPQYSFETAFPDVVKALLQQDQLFFGYRLTDESIEVAVSLR